MKDRAVALKLAEFLTSRRQFLAALGLGVGAISLTPFDWSQAEEHLSSLTSLSAEDLVILAAMSRLLFPHPKLSETIYLDVARHIDSLLRHNSTLTELVTLSLRPLKKDRFWQQSNTKEQLNYLGRLEGKPFFSFLHTQTIETLYRDTRVWALLGYQGASTQHGGYLNRGFDDIDWLQEKEL